MVKIELVYVAADKTTVHVALNLAAGSTVEDALVQSHIYDTHPETCTCTLGIFAKTVLLNTLLRDGDRIELYRPLRLDPKEKRRQLARKK